MRKRMVREKRHGSILAAVLIALLLFTACAPAPTPPAEEKVVEIANICPLTGATPGPEQIGLQGIQDYSALRQ